MQLITLLSTASAMATTATALRSAVILNSLANADEPYARVINRCSYDVYLWSVYKGDGCPTDGMVTLKSGDTYTENYERLDKNGKPIIESDGKTGISIKISKSQQCKGNDITQLEYFREMSGPKQFQYNYLDVSYVDCQGMSCPTRQEGYYLVAGSQVGAYASGSDNTWCPKMSCWDSASCDKISYVLPDDVQTKSCSLDQSLDFYMCGGEAPDGDYSSAPKPKPETSAKSSSKPSVAPTSTPTPTPTSTPTPSSTPISTPTPSSAPVSSPAPSSAPPTPSDGPKITKTQVVYVTAYEYVNAKRHAHDHARRHQPFRA